MKFNIKRIFFKSFSGNLIIKPKKYARKVKRFVDGIMTGMNKETTETIEMADSFFRLLHHKLKLSERENPPSKEEVKAAIEQLKDIGRISVFVTAVILPGGVVSLVGLEILARKYNIKNFNLFPSSFRKKTEIKEKKK